MPSNDGWCAGVASLSAWHGLYPMCWPSLALAGARANPLPILIVHTHLYPPSAGIYDAFKVYVGLPTTGSAEPAKK